MSKRDEAKRQVMLEEFETEFEAEIARGHLEAEGIDATVVKDDAGGMLPSLQQTSGVRLMVTEDVASRARKILDAGDRTDE